MGAPARPACSAQWSASEIELTEEPSWSCHANVKRQVLYRHGYPVQARVQVRTLA